MLKALKVNKLLRNLMVGLAAFVCIAAIATPSAANGPSTALSADVLDAQFAPIMMHQAEMNVREAESVLLSQNQMAQADMASPMTYVAIMRRNEVVPTPRSTFYAYGTGGAALVGNTLIVRGDFTNLTSPLRDYATDPLDPPNPNITSGVHIHQGEPDVNGPFLYALDVTLRDSEMNGRFMGEYELTSEQLQALQNGTLYMDIHTTSNRAGELRGIFMPS
jgi:hypothetical protein